MPGPFLPTSIANAAKKRLADVGRRIPLPDLHDLDVPNPFDGLGDRITEGQGFTPRGVFEASGIPLAARNVATVYNRAQQGSLGFFTGDNPFESVQQAYRGIRGQEEFSPQDLGFARQMPKESTQRRLTGDVLGRIVDPFTLATLGSGAGVRAAETGADIAGPLFREGARRAGFGEVGQTVADITGSLGGGLAGAKGLARPFRQAERAAERQIAAGIQPGMSIQRINPDEEPVVQALLRKVENAKPLQQQNEELLSQFKGKQAGRFETALGSGESGFRRGLGAMRGNTAERVGFDPLRPSIGQAGVDELFDRLGDAGLRQFEHAEAGRALTDILDGIVPVKSELKKLEKAFPGLTESLSKANIVSAPVGGGKTPRPRPTPFGGGGGKATPPSQSAAARTAAPAKRARDAELAKRAAEEIRALEQQRAGYPSPPRGGPPSPPTGIGGPSTPPGGASVPGRSAAARFANAGDVEERRMAEEAARRAEELAQQRSRYPAPPPGGPRGTGTLTPSSQPPNVVRIAEEARKRAAGPVIEPKRKATAFDQVLDILNIPRTVKSSFDLSAPFRQGGVLSARNPKEFWGAWEPMVKSFGSEATAEAVDREIRSGRMGIIRSRTKLYMAPLDDAALSAREEAFASRLATRVPGIEHSQRAYVTFLNKLRADVFDKNYERLVQSGLKGDELTKAQDELASFINWATGRGDIKGPELVSALTNVFFSPKLLASRFQTIRAALPKNLGGSIQNDVVRQIARENVATWMGQNLAVLGLISAAGAATGGELVSVELDPRSSDWGKLRVGNTRIDPWAGFQQIGRSVAQIASGDVKTSTGSVMDKNRLKSVGDFARSKANPALGIGIDQLLGETAIGEDVETGMERLKNLLGGFAPLSPQDIYQGMVEDGLLGAGMGTLGSVGFGVSSYSNPGEKVAEKPYGEFSGQEQFDVHRAYAWQTMGEQDFFKAEVAGIGTYSDWRKKKIEEVKTQLSGMSPAAATATAEKAVDEHPVSQAYTELRNQLEDQWGLENPEEAIKLLDRESKKPEQERTFRPTAKIRAALEEYRSVKQ